MSRSPRITIVHTSFHAVAELDALFFELAPDVRLRHIVDAGLLPAVLDHGGVTEAVEERLLACFRAAEEAGCDVVFSQCSSVGEVADRAIGEGMRVVKIDAEMAERACAVGERIAVVATLETTLGPTRRLIERTAASQGRQISLETRLVPGAFDSLASGDRAQHDRLVAHAIAEMAKRADVVVCAQGSMARVAEQLGDLHARVLTSARLGVQRAIDVARQSQHSSLTG